MCKKLLLLMFPLFAICHVQAQNLSNKGKEFWVGYGHNQYFEAANDQNMVLYLSAEEAATVTVSIFGTTWSQTYTVPANTVIATTTIPKSGAIDARLFDNGTSEGTFTNKAIHIESNVPIVAYAHIYATTNSGATMLMPVETWGYSYITLNSVQEFAANCYSWAFVIANHDNTTVEITPSQLTRTGNIANNTYTIELNKGQIYQFMAAGSGSAKPELTGSKIKSVANAQGECFPIAVFSGSSRTWNPSSCSITNGGDNDIQQCFPQQAWGKRYLTAPTSRIGFPATPMTNVYKVLVKEPTTVVKRNGVVIPSSQLLANSYYKFESSTADYIEADNPVMVGQFISNGHCLANGLAQPAGDPEMMYLSPIEQGINRTLFYRNNQTSISENYLTLIIPNAGLSTLRIDNFSSWDYEAPHPNLGGYTIVVKRWPAAQAQCVVQSNSPFTAITYGLGNYESYGYNAGTLINNLNVIGSIRNNADPSSTTSHPFTCKGSPITLSVLIAYQPTRMEWLLSQVPGLSPNTNQIFINPTPTQTVMVNGVPYYQYTLSGAFTLSTVGNTIVPIKVTHPSIDNCNNTETVSFAVSVHDRPKPDFTPNNYTGCLSTPVQFQGLVNTINSYTISQWNWTFHDATTSTLQNPIKTYTGIGTFDVTLSAVSSEGCLGDTTKQVTIINSPQTSLSSSSVSGCPGTQITFTGNTNTNGSTITNWYWDFGDGSAPITSTNNTTQSHTFNTPGTFTVLYTANSSPCNGDTSRVTVTIHPNPTASFSYPATTCLDPSGLVQFTGISSSNGIAINLHSWNFGDPNATPANPNTSAIQNPSHNYTTSGNYTITYSVTDVNGCTDDSVKTVSFNLKPTLSYSALPSLCANSSPISIAGGSVTNGVTGSGVYHGPATTLSGTFSPAIAGAGTHTIWYVFTSNANCIDSISQTITVHPAPFANFSLSNANCLPVNGLVQFTYTGSTLPNQSYTWAFGDGGTSSLQNPSHNYTTSGTFPVSLTVNTPQGCSDDSVYNATFNLKPALQYASLPAVCSNITTVSVANGSVTNGVAGTGEYHGPATTLSGTFSPGTAGIGTHTIWYVYTTNANCVDSISQTIVVNPSPTADFAIQSANCLPVSGTVQFNYTGTALPGQIYSWNFGDANATPANPNTSNAQNPTHNYINTGNYTITLSVNSGGCVDDSVFNATFNVTPVLDYQALSPICEGANAVSVATATVTNGVTAGNWDYSGLGTTPAGMFDPTTAGPGLHTITATFTSTTGCTASITQQIRVHPRPTANFNLGTTDVCENANASITDVSTISSGSIATWNWTFGDGTNATNTNNQPFGHAYSTYGAYTISLTTTSNNQCTSTPISKVLNVRANPVVDFTMPQAVCMPGNSASFTSISTTADNSSMSYAWNFGDGNTGTGNPASHVYQIINSYNVVLNVTTQYGCTGTNTKAFDAFFDKPVAGFTVSDSAFCQGKRTTFTDISTAPNSTITARKWLFGDGTTSTAASYPKVYSQPGLYDVKLVVWNAQGCISDTFTKQIRVYIQPVVDAGPNFYVKQGAVVQFQPIIKDSSASIAYHWAPEVGLSNPYAIRPLHVATGARIYTLTATGDGGCTASDYISVNVFRPITIPNAFSPNGDGVNDKWEITNLTDYMSATVEVYNRYGQMVYRSPGGYVQPWDGTMNGKPLPFGTYYYIIDLHDGNKPLNGPITIIK